MLLVELFTRALWGVETCKYALCVSGSLARKEACAYSDIECFVLLEDDQHKNQQAFYFYCVCYVR
jgi:hypothetical protein